MNPKEHVKRNLGRITASTMKEGERMKTDRSRKDIAGLFTRVGVMTACVVMLLGLIPQAQALDFPELNSADLHKSSYYKGDTVVLTASATPGTYDISHYYVLCEIGGTTVANTRVDGTHLVHVFEANIAGWLECGVTAYDVHGNPSSRVEATARVDVPTTPPSDNRGSDEVNWAWASTMLIVLIISAVVIAILIAIKRMARRRG